jgi:histidine triad (HIT) family protein
MIRPMADADCIFCKIVAGEIPAQKIDENDEALAFMDINPWTRGHALVIPKTHTKNLWEAPREALHATIDMAQQVAARQRDKLRCDGVNLLNSTEPAAWQTVFHYHVHVIPRYEDDPLQLPGKPQEVDQDELAQVAGELRG